MILSCAAEHCERKEDEDVCGSGKDESVSFFEFSTENFQNFFSQSSLRATNFITINLEHRVRDEGGERERNKKRKLIPLGWEAKEDTHK